MTITVKLFAILRDRAGVSELKLDLPAGSVTSVALDSLTSRYPAFRDHLPRTALAINQDYVLRDTKLNDGDELALIPPVSGG